MITETAPQPHASSPPSEAPSSPPASKTPRVWFVDILRLIASIQMINGHTIGAIMYESIQQGPIFDQYNWIRGQVSVSFLAVSGIAFHLSTLARFEKHKNNPHAVKRRLRRALTIVLIGYLLSFPFGAFSSDPEVRARSWYYFLDVGVLHCIGMSLLLLELLTLAARKASQVVVASAFIALGIFALAPFADQVITDGKPHALLNWISHQGGSMFPLLPWGGLVFAGLVIGAIALPQGGRTPFRTTVIRLVIMATLAQIAWRLVGVSPWSLFDPEHHHIVTRPTDSMEKVAVVTTLILFLAIVCRPIKRLPKLLQALSSETLTIFCFHLVVLYYPGLAIARRFDHTLPLHKALMVSAFMIVFTCSYTYFWHRLKHSNMAPFSKLR